MCLKTRQMQPSYSQMPSCPLLAELSLCFSCDKPCYIFSKDEESEAQMASNFPHVVCEENWKEKSSLLSTWNNFYHI